MMQTSSVNSYSATCPHKKTDFRYELWKKERKALRKKAREARPWMEAVSQPRSRRVVTLDSSRAKASIYVLRLCLRDLGWREFPQGRRDGIPCDIYWSMSDFSENQHVRGGKINKFPGMVEVVRKVNLGRMCDTMRTMFENEYDFNPLSWFLPQQFAEFSDHVRRQQDKKPRPVFIVKPDEGSQGEGIYLIYEPREYNFASDKKHVIQEYIANPLLLEGLKFDFRVYVVLTNLNPLEIFISRSGLARFCTVPYEVPNNKNIHESFMHLTNYSLNKKSQTYLHTESDDDGSKRTMKSVLRTLGQMGYNVEKIWDDIKKLVVKTMIAIAPELRIEHKNALPPGKPGPTCFQILGFDILLQDNGKPVLLEVNANPSFRTDFDPHDSGLGEGITEHINSPVDEEIKRPVLMDALLLVAPKRKPSVRSKRNGSASVGLRRAESKKELDPRASLVLRRNLESQALMANQVVLSSEEGSDSETEILPPPHRGYGTLEQIYPRRFAEEYEDMRILDRVANIFIECLGVRGALRLGSTGFRTFTRKCGITTSGTGLTNASMDIMYIDLQRRWEHCGSSSDYRSTGLCFQSFVEAFFMLAKKRFASNTVLKAVEKLLDYATAKMELERQESKQKESLFPKITGAKGVADGNSKFLRSGGKKQLSASSLLDYKTLPTGDTQIQNRRRVQSRHGNTNSHRTEN